MRGAGARRIGWKKRIERNIDALVSALAAVIADPPQAEQLSEHIQAFDVARTVDAVAALYRERRATDCSCV